MKKKQNKTSFYLNNNNRFIKDKKNEKNLKNFLDKYTYGAYGNNDNENQDNNENIINLREEIEKYEKNNINNFTENNSISFDEIDKNNNFNEIEAEKKYQMEGKIYN